MAHLSVSHLLSTTIALADMIRRSLLLFSCSGSVPSFIEDLKLLETTLMRTQSLIRYAERNKYQNQKVKSWLMGIRYAVYDAEDLLDGFHYDLLRIQVEGKHVLSSVVSPRKRKRGGKDYPDVIDIVHDNSMALDEHLKHNKGYRFKDEQTVEVECTSTLTTIESSGDGKLVFEEEEEEEEENLKRDKEFSGQVRNIARRINEISSSSDNYLSYLGDLMTKATEARWSPQPTHLVDEQFVFGRNKDKSKIIDWLINGSSHNFSAIAIVGKGGLGKTTLAQLVYNNEIISKKFDMKMWFFVPDEFCSRELMKEMVENITGKKCIIRSKKLLANTLKQNLRGKKLLLVLDDVWSEDTKRWNRLRSILACAKLTRLIVTTRNYSVAGIMQTTSPYRLGYLSDDACWELFKHYALHFQDSVKQLQFFEMSKHIIKRCGGSPLAVKAFACRLRLENNDINWNDISDEVFREEILPSLRPSYDRMPIQFRPCFFHCSMFPKDYNFSRFELIRHWIAQGYVQSKDGRQLENKGNEHLTELQNRSLLDFLYYKDDTKKVFEMHHDIHEMAKYFSGNEHLALADLQMCCNLEQIRHLFVGENFFIKFLSARNMRLLRTLVLQVPDLDTSPNFLLSAITLRSLVLKIHNLHKLPDSIGTQLKFLRYLHIESHSLEELPGSLCYLYKLQVLDISNCIKLKDLPTKIGNLINLNTLCLSGCRRLRVLPTSIENLYKLRNLYLSQFHLRWMPSVIGKLTNLEKLHYKRNVHYLN